jgi:hypothetical protein
MKESFKEQKVVSLEELQARLEIVKELKESDTEAYYIRKDRETGEHYLHYSYLHLNVAEGGVEEVFHHLLPIENDDVLSYIFEEKSYAYPEEWKGRYLRTGEEGMVWFESHGEVDYEHYAAKGQEAQQKLEAFKQAGAYDDDAIRKLLSEMEKMFDDKK